MATNTLARHLPYSLSAGLAVLRIVIGAIFIAHGAQKLFVFGFSGVTKSFTTLGIPFPALTGPATALVEFFAGIALILGLLTRLAAFGLALDMLGAILLVRLAGGFFAPKGFEYELALLTAAVALMLTGAGGFSLDALIGRRR